jgi:hypothetical protein
MQAAHLANILEFKACCIGRGKTSVAVFKSEAARLLRSRKNEHLQIFGLGRAARRNDGDSWANIGRPVFARGLNHDRLRRV